MEIYETEDQQVEAIKKWWRENYKMVILVTIVAIGSIFGGQFYRENKLMMGEAASDNFNAVIDAAEKNQSEIINDRTNLLQKDFKDSPYTAQAVMLLAKDLAESGKQQQAIDKLVWVENNAQDTSLQQIALIQRAKLLAATDKNEQALQLLNNLAEDDAFAAVKLETKGDILLAMGNTDEAKKAYDEALVKYMLVGASVEILRVKRNDLGN